MNSIDWTKASELGLVERINREILHPLGLAMCRNPETGVSECILISPDGHFEYSGSLESSIISDEDIEKEVIKLRSDVV